MKKENEIKNIVKELVSNQVLLTQKNIEKLYDENVFNQVQEKIRTKDFIDIEGLIENQHLLLKQYNKAKKWNIDTKKKSISTLSKKINTISDFINNEKVEFQKYYKKLIDFYEIKNNISINKIEKTKKNEKITTIGKIQSIIVTKNKHIMLTIEDQTGEYRFLVNKTKKELYNIAKEFFVEDIVLVVGTKTEDIVFIEEIKELEYCKKEIETVEKQSVVFISDLHVGSKKFMEENFEKFVNYINDTKNQKESQIKYIIITGDLVDGVGIYQNQAKDLNITEISEQYKKAAKLLEKIDKKIKIIIIPGNHDFVSLVEPQRIIAKKVASELYALENVCIFPNPSEIEILIGKEKISFLLYHGTCFDYYIKNSMILDQKRGYENPEQIMDKFLKQHYVGRNMEAAPKNPHKETNVIEETPNFFVIGHLHTVFVSKKKGVYLINPGTFQEKTEFQEKLGHMPNPGRAVLFDFHTKKAKILKF